MELGNRAKEFDVVGFGEIMLRLSPTGLERLSQCETLEKRPGGSELNVVSGISLLGLRTAVITKVPDNDMGRFIKNKIRFYGVSDDCLIYDQSDKKRIGIYYYESGAYPRKPAVMYDRAYSSINSISVDEINPAIYQDTRVFHTSGISLALSQNCRTAAVEMIKQFEARRFRLMSTTAPISGTRRKRAKRSMRFCPMWMCCLSRRRLPGG